MGKETLASRRLERERRRANVTACFGLRGRGRVGRGVEDSVRKGKRERPRACFSPSKRKKNSVKCTPGRRAWRWEKR